MTHSLTIDIEKYKANYLTCYVMLGGLTYCFKCAIDERDSIIAQKLLWNNQDLNCKCDSCKRKIQDVS